MWRLLEPSAAHRVHEVIAANDHHVHHQMSEDDGIPGAIDLCAKNGGVISFEVGGEIMGAVLFTLGSPSNDFSDRETGYIYFMTIDGDKRFRQFALGLMLALGLMAECGCTKVRFRADLRNPGNISMYQKFADPLKRYTNSSGYGSILFGADLAVMSGRLRRYMRRVN